MYRKYTKTITREIIVKDRPPTSVVKQWLQTQLDSIQGDIDDDWPQVEKKESKK